MSADLSDTLSYTCADDSTDESFSISSFRYIGASDGDEVYFHCSLKVCLADDTSACVCPQPPACGGLKKPLRKRRSFNEIVDESEVYHVTAGPIIFKDDKEDKQKDEVDKEGTQKSLLIN